MLRWLIYLMVYLGSAIMIYNICGFFRFARFIKQLRAWKGNYGILYIPIALLIFFLLGYLAVGIFGHPDMIVAGILFGGSVFVFIMYKLLSSITQRIVESETAMMEAELRAVEETNRAKNAFLATISHEMRTPMNMILGMDAIALKNPDLMPETRGHLEKIGLTARHMLGLINTILDLNSIENGKLKLKQEVFSLSEALEQVNVIAQSLCEEKGLDYQFSVPDSVKGRYAGDETQIKQVLIRLLDNAVKFTDAPGKVKFSVECVAEESAIRKLRFTVADTGIGIDRDFLPSIFNVFAQEDGGSTTRYGGSGLSLAAAKGVVDRMGGTISVESEKNVGSTFTVVLPMPFTTVEVPVAAEPEEAHSLAGKRVLVAEDIPMNAEIVISFLEMENMACEHAENGQVALDMFSNSPLHYYDAVLMDLRMPLMNGLDAARAIRALPREDAKSVPIIALTANAAESDVQQTKEAGMNMHMAKPASAVDLYATLKRFIYHMPLTENSGESK